MSTNELARLRPRGVQEFLVGPGIFARCLGSIRILITEDPIIRGLRCWKKEICKLNAKKVF